MREAPLEGPEFKVQAAFAGGVRRGLCKVTPVILHGVWEYNPVKDDRRDFTQTPAHPPCERGLNREPWTLQGYLARKNTPPPTTTIGP